MFNISFTECLEKRRISKTKIVSRFTRIYSCLCLNKIQKGIIAGLTLCDKRTRKLSEYTMATRQMTSEYNAWLAFFVYYTHTYIVCSSDSKSGNWYDNELQTAQIS